ncbi:UNVERIFIED_ORG: Ead/Ea22-like protein [Citrobacter freundii]
MSKIDYQALRLAAEKAGKDKWQAKKINGEFFVIRHGSYTRQYGFTSYQPIAEIEHKPVRDYVAMASPKTILALLDELETTEKHIAELESVATDYALKFQKAQDALKYMKLMQHHPDHLNIRPETTGQHSQELYVADFMVVTDEKP